MKNLFEFEECGIGVISVNNVLNNDMSDRFWGHSLLHLNASKPLVGFMGSHSLTVNPTITAGPFSSVIGDNAAWQTGIPISITGSHYTKPMDIFSPVTVGYVDPSRTRVSMNNASYLNADAIVFGKKNPVTGTYLTGDSERATSWQTGLLGISPTANAYRISASESVFKHSPANHYTSNVLQSSAYVAGFKSVDYLTGLKSAVVPYQSGSAFAVREGLNLVNSSLNAFASQIGPFGLVSDSVSVLSGLSNPQNRWTSAGNMVSPYVNNAMQNGGMTIAASFLSVENTGTIGDREFKMIQDAFHRIAGTKIKGGVESYSQKSEGRNYHLTVIIKIYGNIEGGNNQFGDGNYQIINE